MNLHNMQDITLKDKIVMLRLDLNVQIEKGKVTDTFRIDSVIPTIKYLIENDARVVILSHLGRPEGQKKLEMSLSVIEPILSKKLGQQVKFIDDCIGETVYNAKLNMKNKDIILLENVRFYKEEEENDLEFATKLAKNADIFINDAFATAHRAHASTEGIAHILPSYAGFLIQNEVSKLSVIFENPQHPLTAIIAGGKISTKINVLKKMVEIVDNLIIEGSMGTTFLYAKGYNIGNSKYEPEMKSTAIEILKLAEQNHCNIQLSIDKVVTQSDDENAKFFTRTIDKIKNNDIVQDTGEQSINNYETILNNTKMLLWCGPLGHSEWKPFLKGTAIIAKIIANLTKQNKLISIVGGGDTIAALNAANETENMTYVSTAGGAFLEFMEGKTLPGIKVLLK